MRRLDFFLLIIFSVLVSGCQQSRGPLSLPHSDSSGIIVKFRPGAFSEEGELVSESVRELNDRHGLIGMEQVFQNSAVGDMAYIYKLEFPEGADISGAVEAYSEDPSVVYAEPDYVVHIEE